MAARRPIISPPMPQLTAMPIHAPRLKLLLDEGTGDSDADADAGVGEGASGALVEKISAVDVEPKDRLELEGEVLAETWALKLLVPLVDRRSAGAAELGGELAVESRILI